MEIKEFLSNLGEKNFSLSVDNGKLNLRANKSKVTEDEIKLITSNKDVINYIKTHRDALVEYISALSKLPSAVKSKDISAIYRLSGLQEGMLFHSLYDNGSGNYIEQFTCDLVDLDVDVLTASWAAIIKQHSILRSGFFYDEFSIPVQCVYNEVTLPVEVLDYRELDAAAAQEAFDNYVAADRKKGFDFKKPPLMRLAIFRLEEGRYRMLWSSHHILFDGWSLPVLMGEFLNTYEMIINDQRMEVQPEDKYEDYIRFLERRDKEAEEQYWRTYLQNITQGTNLPFISAVKRVNDTAGGFSSLIEVLDAAHSAQIHDFAKRHRLTVNTLMQGVWAFLLHQYTNDPAIVYGVVVSGRPDSLPHVEQRVGMYINTLPFRSELNNSAVVVSYLQQLQAEQITARDHQYTSLQQIKQWTGIKVDLFDSILVFENYPVSKLVASRAWSLQVSNIHVHEQTNYPLSILIADADDITITFNYNTNLFDTAYTENVLAQFVHVLHQITGNAVTNWSDVALLTPAQHNTVFEDFNNTAVDYDLTKNLAELFEEQVRQSPDATAIVFEGEQLSYTELDKRANQLARHLQKQGVKAETLVPLCLERGFDMITAILAILKAGGAYVPIDPEYPQERINYMLEDTGAALLLTNAESSTKISGFAGTVIELDNSEIIAILNTESTEDLPEKAAPDSLAYVIYTSGSTGKPKGVMNEHKGVVNRLKWTQDYFKLTAADAVLQKTTFCFDVSVWELLWPIITGAKLVFAKPGGQADSAYLKEVIDNEQITLMHFVPSMLSAFLPDVEAGDCKSLKNVLCSGEALNAAQVQLFRTKLPNATIHNLYGPTEAAIDVTYWSDTDKNEAIDLVPIGKPVSNTQLFILNDSFAVTPVGVFGELCIGGVQVARGYLNRAELTAERFIANPFDETGSTELYRTGDLCRWLPDGNIEYSGRKDDQVKIRGYRIELGEIESVAQQSGLVKQAVVIAANDAQGSKRLIGYAVPDADYSKDKLIAYLQSVLPEYMVPQLWVEETVFKLTPNGKIDKRALKAPDLTGSQAGIYRAPSNETEEKLAAIWSELLGVKQIGIDDNFFDLGGHSLLAIRVISQIRLQLGKELVVRELFTHPTVATLSKRILNQDEEAEANILPPITVASRPTEIPLSFAQERLWFIDKLEGSLQYHIPAVFRLKGTLNKTALENTFKAIVNRHEVLRTVIAEKDGLGYQQIQAPGNWKLITSKASGISETELKEDIQNAINAPFDLGTDSMLRAGLIEISDEENILIVTMHHIASDGWSVSVMVREFVELYRSEINGTIAQLPALPVQYADYALWQRAYLQGEVLDKKLSYWKEKLDDVAPLQIITDRPRPAVQSTNGSSVNFQLDAELSKALHGLGRKQGATLYMTLLSVLKVLLHRYSGQQDICVGTPVAGRSQGELEGLIGFLINTLALRDEVKSEMSFVQLLGAVKQTTLEAYEHQDVPFEKVVEAVVKDRDMSRSPLFQVMLVLQNTPDVPALQLGDLELEPIAETRSTANYDLSMFLAERGDEIYGGIEYNTDLYNRDTIEKMIGHYQELISSVVLNPEELVGKLSLLSEMEIGQQLTELNSTEAAYATDKNIAQLFEIQADKTPDATALVFEGEELSYKQLNESANQLARYLQKQGVTAETLVPVCVERGFGMIISILAVLKSGGAYVPVDAEYPEDRIAYMLADTNAKLLISNVESSKLGTFGGTVIDLNNRNISDELLAESKENLPVSAKLDNLAYVIYTSGSTGKPKGVMIEHQNLLNYSLGFKAYFDITAADVVLQQSSISFDTMCEEVYPALISGAKLIIVKEGGKDIDAIQHFLQNENVSILSTTPSVIEWLNREWGSAPNLRYIISGGEVLPPTYISNIFPGVQVVNTYGPSETTVCATYYKIDDVNKASLIGKPVSNTQVYILNDTAALAPAGVLGELCIGGAQVARGYFNRPELTAEKFIADPFSDDPAARLYRTGDLCRLLPDGNIEYAGRKDDQVKIRGYRIEPGEVETAIQQSGLVKQAVVIAGTDERGSKRLIAYVIPQDGYAKEKVTAYLHSVLPEYMVPQLWVEQESFTLTPSGKVDKRALKAPDMSDVQSAQYHAPENETEEKLAAIWTELLGKDKIGTTDNFFELGGHSLLAMRLLSQIRTQTGIDLSVRELFTNPTIAALSNMLVAKASGIEATANLPEISANNRPEDLPLSFAQERLWFIDRLEGSVQYHVPAVFRLKGEVNKAALAKTFQTIVNRHEVLRTVMTEKGGRGYQEIKAEDNWKIEELQVADQSEAELREIIQSLINKPFVLTEDHMLRAALLEISETEHILVVTMHHIASDAWSMPVVVNEVAALYKEYTTGEQANLPELPVQYADYALWQRGYLKEELLDEKLNYWKEKLDDVAPLQLPADHTRPAVQGTKGSTLLFSMDTEIGKGLQTLSREQGVTLYMTLLSVFKVLLYRYSGQEDICVGTSIAGRPRQELEGLIGFFVNTLALRDEVKGEETFTELLKKVKQTTLGAYEHQDVPFEKVVETVVKERDKSRSPLFQVMLVLGNTPEVPEVKLGGLELSGYSYEQTTVKFDLTFFVTETKDGLRFAVQYNTDVYEHARIARMTEHFQQLIKSVLQSPTALVGKLQLLSETEEQQLLTQGKSTVSYPDTLTVTDLFEKQVVKNPTATAVVFEGKKLTYAELNAKANQLAHYLKRQGVKADQPVLLYMDRGIDQVTGIFGILKAGGAYVPVDADTPQDRLSYLLEDTGAKHAVSQGRYSDQLADLDDNLKVAALDELDWELSLESDANPEAVTNPDNLAYVIYTSGSTGKPKGVEISHRNLTDYVYGLDAQINISSCRRFGIVSSMSTDLGNTVLYGSLLYGGELHVFSKAKASHIEDMHAYVEDNRIDCIKIVPSHWKALSPEPGAPLLPSKLIIFGGEALPAEAVQRIQNYSDCRVVNHYGPTETTIGKLLYEATYTGQKSGVIPIGKPFSNTEIYILSKEGELCPVGIPGQLLIGGTGVAKGYLNRTELTKEKFIDNPFAENSNSKLYQTGDRVRFDAEGNVEYLGRIDDQVKIRGYRVEPGEISRILEGSPLVKQAAVISSEDRQGNLQLAGYVVAEGAFDRSRVLDYLREQLPDYMVPAYLQAIEKIPLTASGKVDRKALPDPEGEQQTGGYQAPENETEVELTAIWEDILEIEKIGRTDNFFELGGHSLLAVRLISAVRRAFQAELPISDVFDYPTVAELSARLQEIEAAGILTATTENDDTTNDNTHISNKTLLPQITAVDNRPAEIPLSFSQERLWFIDKLQGSIQYHLPTVLRLKGTVNRTALENTFRGIVNRHEVLRTVISEVDGKGYQQILPEGNWSLGYYTINEISASDDVTNEAELTALIQMLISRPFDLGRDSMLRADLLEIGADEYMLIVTMHHIASDGWSGSVLVKEFVEFYRSEVTQTAPDLPVLPIQYADYALWQRNYLQGETLEQKLNYWREKLDDVAPLQLPTDHKRPAMQSTKGQSQSFRLKSGMGKSLHDLSREQGVTLYMTALSIFKVLLHRYSGQEDICVGTPVAGRNQGELEGLIGFFVNTLALRDEVKGNESFTQLLGKVKQTTLAAYEHQDVPFEKVVEAVVKDRDMSRSPLFQVMLVLQNTPEIPALELNELQLEYREEANGTTKFDLTMVLTEHNGEIYGGIEYNTDLYEAATIARMIGHYEELAASIISDPSQQVSKLNLLTAAEKAEQLETFNATEVNYPTDKSVTELFEAQVQKYPGATALIFEGKTLTYAELNSKANQLARYLNKHGVTTETLVPLCIERGMEMIISILAIQKAGAAYVPIDPEYPEDRIAYMLEDTSANLIVSSKESRDKLSAFNGTIVEIGSKELDKELQKESSSNLSAKPAANNLAYVIYTSGSTGKPKGVMIEHKGLVNLALGQGVILNVGHGTPVLQFASFSFDASCVEIFTTLSNGGSLVLCRKDTLLSVDGFKKIIEKHKVELAIIPPSFQQIIENKSGTLKTIISAGEALNERTGRHIQSQGIRLINGYGPTEITVCATLSDDPIKEDGTVVIGKPIDNVQVYILNEGSSLTPVGIYGELCVGGIQVGRGYFNRPDLTAEKFIDNPFDTTKGAKLYRTGDMCRWLPDGNIEYAGRIDNQVKIRGFRIELGEIESAVMQSGLVKHTIVIAAADVQGNKRLIGYAIPADGYSKEKLIAYLQIHLPEHMVPQLWVEQESFKLTTNGKVDKRALSAPDMSTLQTDAYSAPEYEIEEKLAAIWSELLGVEKIGTNDNFFELGGHSLLAMRVISLIRQELGIEFTIRDLFTYPTIKGIYQKIQTQSAKVSESLIPIKKSGSKTPLYIICGAGGTAFKFKEFAGMLDPEQPVYGLQQPTNIKELDEFPETIEGIAARYVEAILAENPDGKYALSGHCLGGLIAIEAANQLQAMGKEVTMLAMFDADAKEIAVTAQPKLSEFYGLPAKIKRSFLGLSLKIKFELFLLTKHPRQAVMYKARKVRSLLKDADMKPENLDQEVFDKMSSKIQKAAEGYVIKPFNGNIILFNALQQYFFIDKINKVIYKEIAIDYTNKHAWKKYAAGVEIYEVKGEHSTIFEQINALEFSRILQQHLDESAKA
ncbi:hypothetical protein GCM10023149_13960 [Mucilaginibacter gynuensis]|uniref:Carrier domain-containing protein n=1 Tax=Mucilaginibacter gynuensis TaxID=1302236 RepID=A0ABP8G3R0_9SPHI